MLIHYNEKLPLKLDCDASAYGIGAHLYPDGSERPIAYASRSLSHLLKSIMPKLKKVWH